MGHAERLEGVRRDAADQQPGDDDEESPHHRRLAEEGVAHQEGQDHRQQHQAGPGRCRNAGEEVIGPGRPFGLFESGVEAGQPERAADAEQKHQHPSEAPGLLHAPQVQHDRGRDAEADEVGKRIELGAELAGALEHAGDAPVQGVEDGGDDDGDDRRLPLVLQAEAHRGHAGRQRQHGEDVGDHPVEGKPLQAAAADAGH